MRALIRIWIAVATMAALTATANAADKVTFLFPSVLELPAFATWQLAKYLGYYRDAGLDVEFLAGHGGVDAATQVGAGNIDMAEALGDAPIIVRSRGVPVRDVAVTGGGALMTVAGRVDAGIKTLKDLKGKVVSVIGYQDTTYYTLLGTIGTVGLKKTDMDIQALGPAGVVQLFIAGKAQACACLPEWIVQAEDAGVKMNLMPSAHYVPSLAQAIVASDKIIKERPDVVRRFVQATLKAYVQIRDKPVEMAKAYVAAVPAHKGQEAFFGRVFTYYSKFVWANQKVPGMTDPAVFAKVQDLYYDLGVIQHKSKVDDLYTNEFVATK